ncbi:MAG: GNAT family N-acetyltransferase [Azonexus sp.]|jgi:GNAT superfamily N-acetyltransferase|nr:GNAT family N-acetyltransferase [Azonexus sp.]
MIARPMNTGFTVQSAIADDAQDVAVMVGELLSEIMDAVGVQAFNFDLAETTSRLRDFLKREKYFVFVARDERGGLTGFITLYESYALYAEGAFGAIAELYVRPMYRANGLGRRLLDQARFFGISRDWTRLEVTTPPLPQFDRTLAFYEREGFAISGGRKLKADL